MSKLTFALAAVMTALTAHRTASQPFPAGFWRSAPAYVGLFTPAGVPEGAYSAFISDADLETVLRRLQLEPSSAAPGAWIPESLAPHDAFGQSGQYDRSALARLYGAKRVRVARGPRLEDDEVAEAWTLVSPYPDPTLRQLRSGTLLLLLRIRRTGG